MFILSGEYTVVLKRFSKNNYNNIFSEVLTILIHIVYEITLYVVR